MPHPFDHATPGDNLLIYQMVLNRLPFVTDVQANKDKLSSFTWEVMNQLEICFRIADKTAPDNVVGEEGNYSALQQSIIADIVTAIVIMMNAAGGWDFSTGAPGAAATTGTTFLSKAKAGSVEVEYKELKGGAGGNETLTGGVSLLNYYKKSAINKASQLGCIIDICDDCSFTAISANTPTVTPFVVVSGCGCN